MTNIIEYGENWIINSVLPNDILNNLENEINSNLDNFLSDKNNYTCKGNTKQYWLEKQGQEYPQSDALKEAIDGYSSFISDLCIESDLFDHAFLNHLKSFGIWTVRGEEGSFHKLHNHSAKSSVLGLSTVAYLNVPETNDHSLPNNNVYFVMNGGSKNVFSTRGNDVYEVSPINGQVFIFPNWLLHGTYPQSDGLRQTFNIDYSAI